MPGRRACLTVSQLATLLINPLFCEVAVPVTVKHCHTAGTGQLARSSTDRDGPMTIRSLFYLNLINVN